MYINILKTDMHFRSMQEAKTFAIYNTPKEKLSAREHSYAYVKGPRVNDLFVVGKNRNGVTSFKPCTKEEWHSFYWTHLMYPPVRKKKIRKHYEPVDWTY